MSNIIEVLYEKNGNRVVAKERGDKIIMIHERLVNGEWQEEKHQCSTMIKREDDGKYEWETYCVYARVQLHRMASLWCDHPAFGEMGQILCAAHFLDMPWPAPFDCPLTKGDDNA